MSDLARRNDDLIPNPSVILYSDDVHRRLRLWASKHCTETGAKIGDSAIALTLLLNKGLGVAPLPLPVRNSEEALPPVVGVTYDQNLFHKATQMVDWGILVSEWQDGLNVYVVAMSPEAAARCLRAAADAIEEKAKSED